MLCIAAPAAEAARVAYVTSESSDSISQFAVGPGGTLASLDSAALRAHRPRQLAITPDGSTLYVSAGFSGQGKILRFSVAADGRLAAADAVDAGLLPAAMAVRPDGRSLYVADPAASKVRQFSIAADGALTPMAEPHFSLHGPPRGVAVSPDGAYAYVIVDGWIKRYAIGADGAIDPLSIVAIDTGDQLTDLAFSPDGSHLYATSSDARVYQFAVDADGLPTPLATPWVPLAEGSYAKAIAIAPAGDAAYVATNGDDDERTLASFAIAADGQLTPLASALGVPTLRPHDLAITPNGLSVYLAGGDLGLFDVGGGLAASPKATPSIDLDGAAAVLVTPNQSPVARFELVPAPAGSAARFDASAASDPDGVISRFDWDFGDGTVLRDGGPIVEHVYTRPGSYVVRLVVTDNEGASTRTVFTGANVIAGGSPGAELVRVIEVPPAPEPPPPPPAIPAQEPEPDLGETILVEPTRGRVRVRLPGESRFQPLASIREIPVRSLVDTRRGRVLLKSVRGRRGGVQKARFFGGLFLVRQRRADNFITEVVLRGSIGRCPRGRNAVEADAAARGKRRRLWGNGRGRFRTRGRYSSGVVRGTKWLTADNCAGTLTVVRKGRVAVRDFVRNRTVLVGAGERYLARAP